MEVVITAGVYTDRIYPKMQSVGTATDETCWDLNELDLSDLMGHQGYLAMDANQRAIPEVEVDIVANSKEGSETDFLSRVSLMELFGCLDPYTENGSKVMPKFSETARCAVAKVCHRQRGRE